MLCRKAGQINKPAKDQLKHKITPAAKTKEGCFLELVLYNRRTTVYMVVYRYAIACDQSSCLVKDVVLSLSFNLNTSNKLKNETCLLTPNTKPIT